MSGPLIENPERSAKNATVASWFYRKEQAQPE